MKKTARDIRSKWQPIGDDWYCCAPGKCSMAYKNAAAAPTLPPRHGGVVTDAELDAILQPIYDEMDFDAFLADLYSELCRGKALHKGSARR